MLKHLYIIFGSTFLFGFLSGGIIYLANNTGVEHGFSLNSEKYHFVISAYEEGDCTACASFRLQNTGAYTYLVRSEGTEEFKVTDTLGSDFMSPIRTAVRATEFASLMTAPLPACAGRVQPWFRYEIEYQGTVYTTDSCSRTLTRVPLFTELEELFAVFASHYEHPL